MWEITIYLSLRWNFFSNIISVIEPNPISHGYRASTMPHFASHWHFLPCEEMSKSTNIWLQKYLTYWSMNREPPDHRLPLYQPSYPSNHCQESVNVCTLGYKLVFDNSQRLTKRLLFLTCLVLSSLTRIDLYHLELWADILPTFYFYETFRV